MVTTIRPGFNFLWKRISGTILFLKKNPLVGVARVQGDEKPGGSYPVGSNFFCVCLKMNLLKLCYGI